MGLTYRGAEPLSPINLPYELRLRWQKHLARTSDKKTVLSLCATNKQFKQLEMCEPKFWNDMFIADNTRRYREYMYVYTSFYKPPTTLRKAVDQYYDFPAYMDMMREFLDDMMKEQLAVKQLRPLYNKGIDPFGLPAATVLYIMLKNKIPDSERETLLFKPTRSLLFTVFEDQVGGVADDSNELRRYFLALFALMEYKYDKDDQLISNAAYEDEFIQDVIDSFDGFTQKEKDAVVKRIEKVHGHARSDSEEA